MRLLGLEILVLIVGFSQMAQGGETEARPDRPLNPAQVFKLQIRPSLVEVHGTHKEMQELKRSLNDERVFNAAERRRLAREQYETTRPTSTAVRREFLDSFENARTQSSEQARKLAEETKTTNRKRED